MCDVTRSLPIPLSQIIKPS